MINTHLRAQSRLKKFLSYYRPYPGLFLADMACAFILSAVTLILPQGAKYITQQILQKNAPDALSQVFTVGTLMLGLVAIHTLCSFFVDYQGHMMGARMERDMRQELFEHYQKLSFSFYDEHKTGQLMSRLTHDLLWLSELYHHGPEDLALGILTLGGVFVAAMTINVELTLIVFLFVPVMLVYALFFNRRMNTAIRRSHERIGDINTQVEDTLAGIRVVQSFANEALENRKFAVENKRFLESRRDDYKNSGYFSGGMIAFTQLITLVVIVLGGASLLQASLDLADLLTYLLYIGILIEPIQRLVNFARLYQVGITGFNRFMEYLEVVPDIQDAPGAVVLDRVRGDVEFKDVSFKYKDGRHDVIKHVSLKIGAGRTSGRSACVRCASRSASSSRTYTCSPGPSTTISATAGWTPARRRSSRQPKRRMPMTSSWPCRTATPQISASAASSSPEGRNSA
jgi:ATP-binding cassette subfamily B protein